ncbi:hypothetical protein GH740_00955 [Microbacterium sp. SYP-A9085]|uniref:hypothetical protein n=1 Tax=Microbacterium sp. SYP-A9085 TaxID=2664454 RepID=UPI00129B5290|nr:hypothetical protein [Microbacterium sp. SYP-A9085]MRH27886.1 hypothetical protein [Microbacterium sp. SYP-A9085]
MSTPENASPPAPPAPDAPATVPYPADTAPAAAPAEPAYGDPYGGAPQPVQPDARRPKTLALVAMILAIAGSVLALVGFVPFIGLVFSILAGVMLLAAFVLSIVALASRKQGGKGFGVAGLVVSIVGGIIAVVAIAVSAFWIALAAGVAAAPTDRAAAPSVSVSDSVQPSDEPTDGAGDTDAADEAAFVADVRPKIGALLREIQPGATDEMLTAVYSDDTLVMLGNLTLAAYQATGKDGMATEAKSITDASGGAITPDQADRFVQALLDSAQKHLAG